tara:strand:- start:180 stop:422 length:243 start_codon:yes stop_codon:yes gene_type:complete
MRLISLLLFTTLLFSEQETCLVEDSVSNRSIYSIGDTLSIDDQNILFPVCNGSGNYSTGDSFSFSDLDGKITLISMNATW